MKCRSFILILAFIAAGTVVRAQSLEAFKRNLAQPSAAGARVEVTEYGDAATAVARGARENTRLSLRGYRVCIYMDNGQSGQDARAGAMAAKRLFEENYPGVRVHMVYENPYFKVLAGNCLTAEEAIILKGRIASTFPNAFPKREDLSLADLLE